ncbi:hypothetical protein [Coxiella burnetii]|uniref:Uncharacterized protein CBU_2079 n=2 Tax=Coxiella burnetii TaxID=777 RepID=Y2079_COXBU|nr:hypothetical protein [Coxiella burnetii]NP_821049.1 hypothetical protein CBU_2079 [Coxiella burnetii RSA 493]Q83A32.1 RecName: Full=Uncharacterized protein CBU_2079; Flags: Precursor [Coxiella burnetii RSA 493]AAO91563.1 hypothetical protein CBU_2079 [Coxiella burnetii RSA 493]ABS77499.2 hypothetical protein CBUD_2175 [Coxiella burnetii Dugway 5J108-111]ACJ19313.1 hypothetical protein CbuG_2080 [Coxiella burnetii CbuG_Q212]ACJ21216.1 hypothetical protein CbuK_2126 [Coxiella burnetii CbuK_Q
MSYIKRDHTALRDIAMKTFLKVVGLAASLSAASVAFSSYQLIIKNNYNQTVAISLFDDQGGTHDAGEVEANGQTKITAHLDQASGFCLNVAGKREVVCSYKSGSHPNGTITIDSTGRYCIYNNTKKISGGHGCG